MTTIIILTQNGVSALTETQWYDQKRREVQEFCATPLSKQYVDQLIDDLFEQEAQQLRLSVPNDWRARITARLWCNTYYKLRQIIKA